MTGQVLPTMELQITNVKMTINTPD